MSRSLLVVSYHFGENSPTGGFRWNAFAKGLARRGWRIFVVARDRGGEESSGQVPGIHVYPIREATTHGRIEDSLSRGVRFVRRLRGGTGSESRSASPQAGRLLPEQLPGWQPDPPPWTRNLLRSGESCVRDLGMMGWVRRATRVGVEVARSNHCEAVAVSSPPHETQLVGVGVARATGIPYLADFRDPWYSGVGEMVRSLDRYTLSRWRKREASSWAAADVVVHNNWRSLRDLPELGPPSDAVRYSVPNGWDAHDVNAEASRNFHLSFAGVVHPFMDLRPVFAGLAHLLKERRARGQVRLTFVGSDPDHRGISLRAMAEAYGVADALELYPRLPQPEALKVLARSAILLAFDCPHPYAIPSKFYEYTTLPGRLLLIGNPQGAMADAAGRVGATVFDPTDSSGVARRILDCFDLWKEGITVERDASPFSRRHQLGRIESIIENAIARSSQGTVPGDPTDPTDTDFGSTSVYGGDR